MCTGFLYPGTYLVIVGWSEMEEGETFRNVQKETASKKVWRAREALLLPCLARAQAISQH